MRSLERALSRSSCSFSVFWEIKNKANMPSGFDKDAYPEPPHKTPIVNKQTALPNPVSIMAAIFYYAVDFPVTTFKDTIDSIRSKNKLVYYHRKFRRVPDLTECEARDYPCRFEAEMQWRRDFKVNKEILKVMQERMTACTQREGINHLQKCIKETQQYEEVAKNYELCYGDLGANANAKKCLMKQKERMMAAQAQSA